MPSLLFIRHAESAANVGGIAQPNASIPLTEKGHQQAHHRAECLLHNLPYTPTHIYTSTYLRTQQTAAPLLEKCQQTATALDLVREHDTISFELVEGLTGEQRQPLSQQYWQKSDLNYRMGQHAETFAEMNQRVEELLNTLPQFPDKSIIYTHGMFLRLMIYRLLGYPMHSNTHMQHFARQFRFFEIQNTDVFRLTWQQSPQDARIEYCPELSTKA